MRAARNKNRAARFFNKIADIENVDMINNSTIGKAGGNMNKKGRAKAILLIGTIGAMCLAGGFVGAVSVSAEEQTLPISAITENISAVATSSGEMSVATGKHTTRTGLWYFGKDTEWQSQTGVQTVVSAASGIKAAGTVTYKKDIDLSCFTKDDYLARCMPWNENIASITMKLIDSADSGNYVSVKWESDQNYYYEGSGYKTYLGSDCTITYNNGTEYATTAPKYESGLIMGLLFPMQDVFGNEGGVGCNILGDGSSIWVGVNSEYIDMFSLAYENGKFYTPRNEYDLTGWKGFADEKAKLEISYTSFNNNNGLMFTHLAGLNVRGSDVENQPPLFSNVNEISVKINEPFELPVSAFDPIDGALPITVEFFKQENGTWKKEEVANVDGKYTITRSGKWKAVVSAIDGQGQKATKDIALTIGVSAESLLSAETGTIVQGGAKKDWFWYFYDKEGYNEQSGIAVTSEKTSGKAEIAKTVDLSVFDRNESLVKCIPYDNSVSSISIKLTDTKNAENYVLFTWQSNTSIKYTTGDGTTYLGSDLVISYYNGKEIVTTESVYEYGLIMGNTWPLQVVFGNQGGVGLDIKNDGNFVWVGPTSDWRDANYIDHFSLAYEAGKFYTPRGEYTLENWIGFTEETAKIEISYTSTAANNGLLVNTLLGTNVRDKDIADEAPKMRAPGSIDVYLGEKNRLPEIAVWDVIDEHNTTLSTEFYKKTDNEWRKVTIETENEMFTIAQKGEYKIVATAKDTAGNEAISEILINALVRPIEFNFSQDYESVYFVGERFDIFRPAVNYEEGLYTLGIVVKKDGVEVDLNNFPVTFSKENEGEYIVEYKAISVYGSETEKKYEFSVREAYQPKASYTITNMQGLGDVDIEKLPKGYTVALSAYKQSDTEKASLLPYKNLPSGNYILEIQLFIEGRKNSVVVDSVLIVTAASPEVNEKIKSEIENGKYQIGEKLEIDLTKLFYHPMTMSFESDAGVIENGILKLDLYSTGEISVNISATADGVKISTVLKLKVEEPKNEEPQAEEKTGCSGCSGGIDYPAIGLMVGGICLAVTTLTLKKRNNK